MLSGVLSTALGGDVECCLYKTVSAKEDTCVSFFMAKHMLSKYSTPEQHLAP